MIDIPVLLFKNFHLLLTHPKSEAMARKLSSVGFEEVENSIAPGCMDRLQKTPMTKLANNRRSFRVFSSEEQHMPLVVEELLHGNKLEPLH